MLSLISLNDPSDRAVLLRCANTLRYIHGLSGSYDTETWKYYIINLRFNKLQQIFRPRIIIIIQVHSKKVYSREIKKYQLYHLIISLYSILFYPITLEGRRGTTDEFATIPFHLDLFSAALVELAKSIPVHSLILSSHLFFCLPLFLFPFTVPCRIVFAKPEDL